MNEWSGLFAVTYIGLVSVERGTDSWIQELSEHMVVQGKLYEKGRRTAIISQLTNLATLKYVCINMHLF